MHYIPLRDGAAAAWGAAAPTDAVLQPPARSARIVAVDALRGFDMLCIIGGNGLALALRDMLSGHGRLLGAVGAFAAWQFEHAAWQGLHFYDLLFPLFVFVVGVAIPLAVPRAVARDGRRATHWRVVRRSLVLFLLGFLYYGGLSHRWPDIRLMGVLQRIGLCYLVAALLFLNLRLRGLVVVFVVTVVGYWALMTFVPVPGVGAGSYARGANLAQWIDKEVLPGAKLTPGLEPEGLLSTLPAVATTLLGIFAGLLLQDPRLAPRQKVLWLYGAGAGLVVAGSLWALQVPLIKDLWTSSYVLVTGGLSALLLGAFYQVIEVWGWRGWTSAFVWVGANAIVLYLINDVARFHRLASRLVGGNVGDFLNAHVGHDTSQFLANAVGLALVIALARFLYRRNIFIRV